jgi:Rps23 Pro-64 3,4-dihydroxylase Tpa1-like proline 4-hydroxylase
MGKKDVDLLKSWINPLYLLPQNIKGIATQLSSEGYVQLADFFEEKMVKTVVKDVKATKVGKSYQPDLHRYQHGPVTKKLDSFIQSVAFRALLGTMVGQDVKKVDLEVLYFCAGDYTLLHDMEYGTEGLLLWFDFTADWEENFGGMTVCNEEGNDPLLFAPAFNALHVVSVGKDTGMFVKYVNCLAGKKKIIMVKGWL